MNELVIIAEFLFFSIFSFFSIFNFSNSNALPLFCNEAFRESV